MTTESIEIAKWIEEGTLPVTADDFKLRGNPIGHCIPPKFESYCKIFHPFEITSDEPDILEPNKEYGQQVKLSINNSSETGLQITEIKNDGTAIDIFARQQQRLEEYNSKTWEFITWEKVSEKYGLTFHNEISPQTFVDKFQKIGWPINLKFPSEGYLPRQHLVRLLKILNDTSTSDEIYIYQMPPNTIWKSDKGDDLVKCSFNEVLEYFNNDFIGYLYSADKSWVVYTDTDLTFTIVGGQKRLIDVLVSSDLEVLKCDVNTRVDNYSDKINEGKAAHNSALPKAGRSWWQKLFGSE